MNTTIFSKQDDRWDLIAYRAYGDVLRMGDVIRANPQLPIWATIPVGIEINIPVIEKQAVDISNLPPWRR